MYYIIRHLTSNLLPHYTGKFECSTVKLYTIVILFRSVTSRLFTVNIYRNVMFWIKYLCQLICTSSKCLLSARIHDLCHPCQVVNGCINDASLQACAKHVAGAVAIYCAGMMSDDVNSTQKGQLS